MGVFFNINSFLLFFCNQLTMMRQIFVILTLSSMMQAEGKLLPKICKHFSDADICDKVEARGLKSDLKKGWDKTKHGVEKGWDDIFNHHHHHHHHPSDEPKQKAEARGLKKDLKKAWDDTKDLFKHHHHHHHPSDEPKQKAEARSLKKDLKKGWDKTKQGVKKAYDKTKEGFKKGWDKTKDYFDKTVQP